jgi:hypothetical protein
MQQQVQNFQALPLFCSCPPSPHLHLTLQMFIGNITSTAADSLRASLHRVATLGRHRTLGHNISGVHRSSGSAATLGFTLSSPFALGYDSNSGRFRGQASSGKRTGSSPQTHLHTSPHAPAGMSPARGSSARAYSLPRAGSLPAHATRLSNSAAPAILAARASASADQQPGDLLAGRADSFVALAAFHPDMAGGYACSGHMCQVHRATLSPAGTEQGC